MVDMHWRHLRSDELDHELIWFSVSVAAALIAWIWLRSGIPTPICLFHEFTGVACPGCGATRCVRDLMKGSWTSAFLMNPMVFTTAFLFVIYDLYAATVLALRLPRLRFDPIPSWLSATARFGIPALILLNWGWLVYSKV
jgi:hypothetical protein